MDYTIRAFDQQTGQIVVEYRGLVFSIDLQLDENNMYPEGEALDALIRQFIPVWHFERLDKIPLAANPSAIAALVVPFPDPPAQPENLEMRFDATPDREYIKEVVREVLAEG